MELIQNDWYQRDIINIIKILTKRGSDKIHAIIPTKYQKYSSYTKLNTLMFLAKVNKSPYGNLLNISSNNAYIITIQLHTMTLEDIRHEQRK